MTDITSEFVRLVFLQAHRETDRFFAASGVQLRNQTVDLSTTAARRSPPSCLAKVAALRIILNIDGVPVVSRSHTHPSHSQISRLLILSLSLGVPVPRATSLYRLIINNK
jgi:hypothetical protein